MQTDKTILDIVVEIDSIRTQMNLESRNREDFRKIEKEVPISKGIAIISSLIKRHDLMQTFINGPINNNDSRLESFKEEYRLLRECLNLISKKAGLNFADIIE